MKDIFKYHKCLKPICQLITKHKYRKLIGWGENFEENGYVHPEEHDFYYKCKICGWVFFNHNISDEDLEKIKNGKNKLG